MEAVATAAAMVDLNTLSRRELQALCKLNGVRANMTNVAMLEALQSLPSVDGIDQVGTTLCLPTPGKSAMKPVLRTAAASDQQQQGSPLPRGRRVSVKSPEAIRLDAEGEEDDTKRDLIREIVRTPGVALRSTSRRPQATPAPLPTPAAGTLRRSQRSTVRKATTPVEVNVSTTKRSTRKTAVPKVKINFDQEEEDAASALEEDKVQQAVEPEGATSDEKCDVPEEEEVTNLPEEGNSKADEPEQGEEGAAAVREEQNLVNAEKSATLSAMEGSPILCVLSKEAPEPAMKKIVNASAEDREIFANWSPVLELSDEINSASEDKEVVAVEVPEEAVKEDAVSFIVEDVASNNMVSAAMTEKEVAVDESTQEYDLVGENSEEADLTEQSSEVDDLDQGEEDMLKADRTVDEQSDETIESASAPNKMFTAAVTEKEVSVDQLQQADLTEDESAEEYDLTSESSEEADLTEESSEMDGIDDMEENMLNADQTVDEESDYTIEVSGSIDVNFGLDEEEEQLKMLETGEETKEVEESDSLIEEEDDFSTDLSSEFDNVLNFSDAKTASDSSSVALEGTDAAAAASSAAKTVESRVESVVTEEIKVSSEEDVVSQHVETIVESLDKVTITEEKKEECAKEKKQLKVVKEMSLRKLKSAYKESLIAAKEGKKLTIASYEGSRMALAELDNNAEC